MVAVKAPPRKTARATQIKAPTQPVAQSELETAPGSHLSDEAETPPHAGAREYRVLTPLDHDNVRYGPGSERDTVMLTDEQAQRLPVGVVVEEN